MEQAKKGFALPMIVITGFVLMIILAFSLQTIAISRDNLINQRAQLLAKQAAESGLARAQQCIQKSNQLVTWSESKPLRPNTDCNGDAISGKSEYITVNDTYRSTFVVRPSGGHDEFRNIISNGTTETLKKKVAFNSANPLANKLKTYKYGLSAYIRTNLSFDDIAFGSVYVLVVGSGGHGTQTGAHVYFQTKSMAGAIAGAGRNYYSVLTGDENPQSVFENGVVLPTHNFPSKVKKMFTNFQGVGWNTFFLLYDGSVYASGAGYHGNKGNDLTTIHSPWTSQSRMLLESHVKVKDIVTVAWATFVLSEDGQLYGMGSDVHGYGVGSPPIGRIGCYANSICRQDQNYNRYINNPKGTRTETYYDGPSRWLPKPVRVTTDTKVLENVSMAVADTLYSSEESNICAIGNDDKNSTERKVYCWGDNSKYQIADRHLHIHKYSADAVPYAYAMYTNQNDKPVDVQLDGQTIYILTEKGNVFARGSNEYSQIGPKRSGRCDRDVCLLTQIHFPRNVKIKKMIADSFFALFLDENGDVWGTGMNRVGQLGTKTNTNGATTSDGVSDSGAPMPRQVFFPNNIKIVDFAIASPGKSENSEDIYRNSFFIDVNGDVWGTGSNYFGQLGVGDSSYDSQEKIRKTCPDVYNSNMNNRRAMNAVGTRNAVTLPVKMCLALPKYNGTIETHKAKVNGVKTGLGTTVIITDKNKVFTVGNNHEGQLGAGDFINRSIPAAHRLTNQWSVYYY